MMYVQKFILLVVAASSIFVCLCMCMRFIAPPCATPTQAAYMDRGSNMGSKFTNDWQLGKASEVNGKRIY